MCTREVVQRLGVFLREADLLGRFGRAVARRVQSLPTPVGQRCSAPARSERSLYDIFSEPSQYYLSRPSLAATLLLCCPRRV